MSGVTVSLRKEQRSLTETTGRTRNEHWDQKFRNSYLWENSQVHFHLRLTFECHAMNSKLTDQVTTVKFPRPLHGHVVDYSLVQSQIRTLIFLHFLSWYKNQNDFSYFKTSWLNLFWWNFKWGTNQCLVMAMCLWLPRLRHMNSE